MQTQSGLAVSRAVALLVLFCSLPVEIHADNLEYVEIEKIFQSDAGAGDVFGEAIAFDGDTFVAFGGDFGKAGAYVFERNAGGSNQWNEVMKLETPDGVIDDQFGVALAIEADTIAAFHGPTGFRSVIHLFERDPSDRNRWEYDTTLHKPDLTDPIWDSGFGLPDFDGDTLVIGAGADSEIGIWSGAVYVYERDSELLEWRFTQKIIAADTEERDLFGSYVGVDGNTLVASAPWDDANGPQSGSVYVFERDPKTTMWSETTHLFPTDGSPTDDFGVSVALEGDYLAVGAPSHMVDGVFNSGAVYVYERNAGGIDTWGEVAKLVPTGSSAGDNAGEYVRFSGGRLIVGVPGRPLDGEAGVGAVYFFERDELGEWLEVAHVAPSTGNMADRFGQALAASSTSLVVGMLGDDTFGLDSGAVYVFEKLAQPDVAISGSCPGTLTVSLMGATPHGSLALASSQAVGTTVVAAGDCVNTELELQDAQLMTVLLTDAAGRLTVHRDTGASACGLLVQAVDLVTCGVGEVGQTPRN